MDKKSILALIVFISIIIAFIYSIKVSINENNEVTYQSGKIIYVYIIDSGVAFSPYYIQYTINTKTGTETLIEPYNPNFHLTVGDSITF